MTTSGLAGNPNTRLSFARLAKGTDPELNVARLNHAHQIPIRERKPGRQDDKPHDSRLTRFECEPGVAEQLRRRSADRRDDVVS